MAASQPPPPAMNPSPTPYPRLLPLGDAAWTVEFGAVIDFAVNAQVHGFCQALKAAALVGVVDLVLSFRSLTVHYDPAQVDAQALGAALLDLAQASDSAAQAGRHWLLPACFDEACAPDLPAIAAAAGLSLAAAVDLLTATTFRVFMIGFQPGFPYMGGLPAALQRPRLASPRARVPARSIAVADAMCGVYPWASPGGWNLVGSTPLHLFAADEAEPALLAAGDFVQWQAVDRKSHDVLVQELATGQRQRRDFLVAASA